MQPLRRARGAIYSSCYHNAARAIARIAHFLDLEEEAFEEIGPAGLRPPLRPRWKDSHSCPQTGQEWSTPGRL